MNGAIVAFLDFRMYSSAMDEGQGPGVQPRVEGEKPPATGGVIAWIKEHISAVVILATVLGGVGGVAVAIDRATTSETRLTAQIAASQTAITLRMDDRFNEIGRRLTLQEGRMDRIEARLLDVERRVGHTEDRQVGTSSTDRDGGSGSPRSPAVEAVVSDFRRQLPNYGVMRTFDGHQWGLWVDAPGGVSFRALQQPDGTFDWTDEQGHPAVDPRVAERMATHNTPPRQM